MMCRTTQSAPTGFSGGPLLDLGDFTSPEAYFVETTHRANLSGILIRIREHPPCGLDPRARHVTCKFLHLDIAPAPAFNIVPVQFIYVTDLAVEQHTGKG